MKVDAKTENEIKSVIKKWADTYARRDIAGALSLYVKDDDVVMVGSGADEVRIGLEAIKEQYERDWAQTDSSVVDYRQMRFSKVGSAVAVFNEALIKVKAGGQSMEFPLRITGILENRDGKWLFAQLHASMPATGQDEGQSFPVE